MFLTSNMSVNIAHMQHQPRPYHVQLSSKFRDFRELAFRDFREVALNACYRANRVIWQKFSWWAWGCRSSDIMLLLSCRFQSLLSYHVYELIWHKSCLQCTWRCRSIWPIWSGLQDHAMLLLFYKFGGFIDWWTHRQMDIQMNRRIDSNRQWQLPPKKVI